MSIAESFALALKALRKNGLRSCLTLLGVTIGVGAVLTMVAVGNGARASIEDQVTAAGMNIITVTAGNYRMKGDDAGGGVADHQAALALPDPDVAGFDAPGPLDARSDDTGAIAFLQGRHSDDSDGLNRSAARPSPDSLALRPAVWRPQNDEFVFRLIGHPEDDPMEKHNHPTARERLGDSAAGLGAAATLTLDDATAIRHEIAGVQYVASGVHESARVAIGDKRWFTRLHGTEPDMPRIRRSWTLKEGRFISSRESADAAQVVVLGSVVRDKLVSAGVDPIGLVVKIWNQPFTVVGVVASTTWTSAGAVGDDQFDAVYMPVTTVHRLLNLSKLNTITVTAKSVADTTRVSRGVTALLRKRHGIAEAAPDDFVVRTQASAALGKGINPQIARAIAGNVPGLEQVTLEQLSTTLERSSRTMTALLASVAAVSLLVGGIGVMNIMLLSVTERTREIGLRMALGARPRDVMLQFLAEAVTLSLVGGLIGVVLGLAASGGVRQALRWSAVVSPAAIVLSVAVAALVGVGFGLYPARQASRLDPIDALRFE
jgi:putative ABC transport system permease protein